MNYYNPTGIKRFDNALLLLDNHLHLSGRTKSTRIHYNSCLRVLMLFSDNLPEKFSKNELINQILLLKQKRGFGYGTLKIYIFSLKYYLNHVVERVDLWEKIPNPKIKSFNFEVLTICEIQKLFEACQNPREKFIIHILFETGIRVQELLQLSFFDFDFHNRSICIRNSKNGKTRTVYFGKNFENTFKDYYYSNKNLFSESHSNKEFYNFIPISKRKVRRILRNLATKSGVTKKVNPHAFRHAFAVHYINFGGTLYQLQRILGHSHMSTTCNYLQYASIPQSIKISVLDKVKSLKRIQFFEMKRA